MKKITTLAASLFMFIATGSHAQLKNGSIAPNFTLTDINGNTHDLYTYLNSGKTVFVAFSATWCGPCKAIDPTIKKMESEFSNVTFAAVDIDDSPELAQKYKIKSLPSLILMRNGQ